MSMGIIESGKYNKVAGNGDSMKLIRDMYTPDWSNAVALATAQLDAGYTVTKRGLFFGNAAAVNNTYLKIYINNKIYVNIETSSSDRHNSAEVCVPVNPDDIIKSSNLASNSLYFVPYKVQ